MSFLGLSFLVYCHFLKPLFPVAVVSDILHDVSVPQTLTPALIA